MQIGYFGVDSPGRDILGHFRLQDVLAQLLAHERAACLLHGHQLVEAVDLQRHVHRLALVAGHHLMHIEIVADGERTLTQTYSYVLEQLFQLLSADLLVVAAVALRRGDTEVDDNLRRLIHLFLHAEVRDAESVLTGRLHFFADGEEDVGLLLVGGKNDFVSNRRSGRQILVVDYAI